jgi:hypothetical protein
MRYAALLLVFFLFSACITVRKGNVSSSSIPLDTNYRIVGMAQGASKNFTILGFGGGNKDALILDAKRNMYWNYALAPDERFANYTLDFKSSFFLVFKRTEVIVSADIMGRAEQNGYNTNTRQASVDSSLESKALRVGDTLYASFGGFTGLALIMRLNPDGGVITGYYNDDEKFKTKTISAKRALRGRKIFLKTPNPGRYQRVSPKKGALILAPPSSPQGPLVAFMLEGQIYLGELMEKRPEGYLIRCVNEDGEKEGFIIQEKNVRLE